MSQADIDNVRKGVAEFRAQINSRDFDGARRTLSTLKRSLTGFKLMPPFERNTILADQQLAIAREILEQATLLSVISGKIDEFERHMSQLKPFYYDYQKLLPQSELQWPILGLNLMYLLVSNKLSEFHTELELIPYEQRGNRFVQFPISLEQDLMEGSYNKVLAASQNTPSPYFKFFLDILIQTVRKKIATCTEKAYERLPIGDATKLLMFKSDAETSDYVTKRGWLVSDSQVILPKPEDRSLEIPSLKITRQTLEYATELERIV